MKFLRLFVLLCTGYCSWLFVLPADAYALEERCSELGANCICSETLDTSALAETSRGAIDPTVSTVSTKQCPGEGGDGGTLWRDGQFDIITQTGMPTSSVRRVIANRSNNGMSFLFGRAVTDASVRRVCTRVYVKYSSDYQAKDLGEGGSCEANKAASYSWGGNNSEMHWDFGEGANGWRLTIINFDNKPSYNLLKSGALRFEDCKTEWCRMEMCASGNISSGKNIWAEAYVQGISTQRRMDWQRTFIGNANFAGRLHAPWVLNMYRQNFCRGSKYISYAMQAEWNTDNSQIIGPSCEVEGLCDSTKPDAPGNLEIKAVRVFPWE